MDIELNKAVMSQDGEQIGEVERLIVNPEERIVREFIIKEGTFLSTDRIVDIDLITGIDDDGTIHLSIPAEKADTLPPFVETRYVAPSEQELNEMPQAWFGAGGAAGGGPLFWAPHTPASAQGEPGQGSIFDPASPPAAPPEPDYAVDQSSVVIDEGTNVVDREGAAVGTVDEVHYDNSGRVARFKVDAGTIFSKKLDIPLKWVDSIQPDAVRLSVTSEEAEASGEVKD